MKLLLVTLFCIAAYNVAYGADPYNQEEGDCGCCPLPCCCVCIDVEEEVEPPPCPTQTQAPVVCTSDINIGFIVDVSGSITPEHLPEVQGFLKMVVNAMQGDDKKGRSAMVSYASNATIIWKFDDDESTDAGKAELAIDGLMLGEFTNVVEGMERMIEVVEEDPNYKDGREIPYVFMVLSDGRSFYRTADLGVMALNLKIEGDVHVVGVTNLIFEQELETISSDGTFTKVLEFTDLEQFIDEIILKVCPEVKVVTAAPCPTLPPIKVEGECSCCCPSPYRMGPPGSGYC